LEVSPVALTGQSADSAGALPALIAAVAPAASVRLATGGQRWSGTVALQPGDSLALVTAEGKRGVHLSSIDSLWVRRPQPHHGVLAGAGFGALMFGLLQLEDTVEDPGLNTRIGLALLAGGIAAGLLVDAVSDPWVRRFPSAR